MEIPIYQVDAFTDKLFGGNPAAVCPLDAWLDDTLLQSIAEENKLSETAFFVPTAQGFHLRWFTPAKEVQLCGHATLASAHVLYQHLEFDAPQVNFDTLSGPLMVHREEGWYSMNLPDDPAEIVPHNPLVERILGLPPIELYRGREDYMAILPAEEDVLALQPDFRLLEQLDGRGLIATAAGKSTDFVSRCFFPKYGIDEDPVTGSAHTTLMSYWAGHLGKKALTARQVSARSGFLRCRAMEERVEISGQAVTYMQGTLCI